MEFKHVEHEECYGCSLSMSMCEGCPVKHSERFIEPTRINTRTGKLTVIR